MTDPQPPGLRPPPAGRQGPPVDALHPALGRTTTRTCPSSSAARAPTSGTRRASATSTALAGLFVYQLGHGRTELAEAAAKQAARAGLHAAVVLRAPAGDRARRADRRLRPRRPQPGLLHHRRRRGRRDRLEAGQELLQAHRQADQAQGDQPGHRLPRHHPGRAVDHRPAAAQAAVRAAGALDVPGAEHQLLPRAASTAPRRTDVEAFGRWAADQIAVAIENEGPDTVAAVFLEPVQNAGGCFPPPPGYFQRVREICDEYDVLLVSDEVICAFGRLGHMFGAERYGYQPDMITCAKGITSGYAPLGAMIATDRLMEPFLQGRRDVRARLHLRRPPGLDRGRDGQPRHLREREASSSTSATTRARSAPPSSSSRTCRSSATSAATATSTASSWSRTRRPRRPSTTRSASGCCYGFVSKAALRRGPLLPRRRPRRPGRPALAAADLRPRSTSTRWSRSSARCSTRPAPALSHVAGTTARSPSAAGPSAVLADRALRDLDHADRALSCTSGQRARRRRPISPMHDDDAARRGTSPCRPR